MTIESKNVVVTGGAGAIGSRLVRRCLEEGAAQVLVLDDFSSGHEWLLPGDPRVRLWRQDVARLPDSGLRVERPLVFHLAAFFANQNSVDHPTDDLHTNGLGTLATLLWARENEAERVVYASAGCSVAGHGLQEPIREDMPVSLALDTPYQITKLLGEYYCNYFLQQGLSTVRCRFFNSYGPGEVPGPYRNVVPNFIWKALHGEPLGITGTGQETRDFIYVEDLVEGLVRCAVTPEAHGGAFNLGTGIETRILELAHMILKECGSHSRIEHVARRSWDKCERRQADIRRARSVLGFAPRMQLEQGIRETVRWFRGNRERVESEVQRMQATGVGA